MIFIKGQVIFLDGNKEEIKRIPINKLDYRESKIKEMSIEKFRDDDPCIIHKTYCINALSFELLDKLNKMDKKNINKLYTKETILNEIKEYIKFPKGVKYIKFI